MAENKFRKCEKPITEADLDALESLAGFSLPADFRAHYLAHNGGVPERTWWDSLDENPPCAVIEFRPIRHGKHSLEAAYRSSREKRLIPENFLPFASGSSNSCFCLDMKNGVVLHYAPDNFVPEKTPEENFKKAQRKLSHSFREFVVGLVSEKELDF